MIYLRKNIVCVCVNEKRGDDDDDNGKNWETENCGELNVNIRRSSLVKLILCHHEMEYDSI